MACALLPCTRASSHVYGPCVAPVRAALKAALHAAEQRQDAIVAAARVAEEEALKELQRSELSQARAGAGAGAAAEEDAEGAEGSASEPPPDGSHDEDFGEAPARSEGPRP